MQVKINQYDTVETGRYNGKWQMKPGKLDQEGGFRPDFKSIKRKDGSSQSIPVSITFDTDANAIAFLKACIAEIVKGE